MVELDVHDVPASECHARITLLVCNAWWRQLAPRNDCHLGRDSDTEVTEDGRGGINAEMSQSSPGDETRVRARLPACHSQHFGCFVRAELSKMGLSWFDCAEFCRYKS